MYAPVLLLEDIPQLPTFSYLFVNENPLIYVAWHQLHTNYSLQSPSPAFLCAKRPQRKPRRGPQREPTPMCSPCLSRPRSRNLKRWERLRLICISFSRWFTRHEGCCHGVRRCVSNRRVEHCDPSGVSLNNARQPPSFPFHCSSLQYVHLSIFLPPAWQQRGLWYVGMRGQRCPDIQPVSSVIRLQINCWACPGCRA